jgi:3-mercaptopyruvate sulfurtransferase SseA
MSALLLRSLTLLLVGGGLGLLVNAVRSDGVPLRGYAAPVVCAAGGAAAHASLETLDPAQAVRMCGDPGVLMADVRPPERFADGHVANAVHLPCAASGTEASSVVARAGGRHTLIVYGDTTDEARPVAEDLSRRIGRSDVRVVVLEGGFPAWSRAGLACASGPCPECGERAGAPHSPAHPATHTTGQATPASSAASVER